MIPHTSA